MLVTALLTAHVNRWVIQLSSYCGVNELGSAVWVCVRVSVCLCLRSQTEAQRTDGEFRRRLTHRNQAITHSMTPPDVRVEWRTGRKMREKQTWGWVIWGGDVSRKINANTESDICEEEERRLCLGGRKWYWKLGSRSNRETLGGSEEAGWSKQKIRRGAGKRAREIE